MKSYKIFSAATTPRLTTPRAGATTPRPGTPAPGARIISTKVPPSVYDQLVELQRVGGYGSLYELLQAMIFFFVRLRFSALHGHSDEHSDTWRDIRDTTDDSDEIAAMFREYSDHDPTPQAGHAPRRRRKVERL